jgi:hypothetical protein
MPVFIEASEVQLHALWMQQKIPHELLHTIDGRPVEVINAGEYNHEGGPDFRRATLRLEDKILQGDIEIHIHGGDWIAHGHHLDPAYNDVILHLAVHPPNTAETSFAILRENGLPVLQVSLPAEILSSPPIPQGSLAFCPLSQTSPEKISATVRQAGLLRLEAKASAFAEQLAQASWDQVIYRGIAEALGYDKNQEAFRRLAESLPIELLFAELRATREIAPEVLLDALLFGAAGFLAHDHADAECLEFVAPRLQLWEKLRHTLQIRPLPREAWQFFRLRPPNFPTRRLAALSALILKFYRAGIVEHLLTALATLGRHPKMLVNELVQHVMCPATGYWQWHYDLRSRQRAARRSSRAEDLIGRERALDIVVNIFMPALWRYYRDAGDGILQSQVQEAYGALPKLQDNQITRHMRRQLADKYPVPPKPAKTACGQQGLIHLQKLYCRPLRCQECLALTESSPAK